jgi:hypothetical protein
MTDWYVAAAAITLQNQVNARWPNRDHGADGTLGDASHQAVPSDHNPDWSAGGVVRALDIDSDLRPDGRPAAQELANQLIALARARRDFGRLSYVIHNHQIASGTYADHFWTWRPYDGDNPHEDHIHVSFTAAGDHNGARFPLPLLEDEMALDKDDKAFIRAAIAEEVWKHEVQVSDKETITYATAVNRWQQTRSAGIIATLSARATVKSLKAAGLLAADVDEEAIATAVVEDLAARLADG